ncbi:uncharacterized protein LOC128546231 [Mercenaria mercenaria]|uniref:uncharacterized protein LOC128546231 n=1 Tax=Mercenaria mercenaria TaxID=6596 RepID=UPI00234E8A79|nr:uncharacterized protein LOC128546231 [Mercenaria mercenaria]
MSGRVSDSNTNSGDECKRRCKAAGYRYAGTEVCRYRDSLYYSKEMELDSSTGLEINSALINVFKDDYIVTSKDEALVHADVIAALSEEAKYLEQKITSCQETNQSEKEIEDEEVHVKKRRFDSILKESLQAVLLPQESKVERLEPGISGQEVPAKKRRLVSTIYGHSYAINMPTESDAGQEPTASYRTDHSVEDIEDYKTQLEKIKTLISVHREKMAYIDSKIDIQKRLVKLYWENCVKVPALPIQPEENQKDVGDVYVEPWMTIIEEDDPSRKTSEVKEREISSFFEVFQEGGKPIKTVYVLGEAGTGKSTFCKSLVHKWCKVHTDGGYYIGEDKRIIKRFEFLFFILLRHHLDKQTIEMMLDSQFRHPVLQKILDIESDKCLILLDGLDEWIPKSLSHSQMETKGLPARDNAKDYTVVTTSRPWKIGLLGMTTNQIHKKVMLRGIDRSATKILIEKTIKLLNATFEEDRSPEKFIKYLKTSPLSDIRHIPILLEQLICLWYENNDLSKSSRCTLYNGMLELPFKWFDQRQREKLESNHGSEIKGRSETKDLLSLPSPHELDKERIYPDYRNTIDNASKLAFELLFKQRQENTLSFDIQTCKRLQIPLDVLKICVNIGILSEEKTIGFTSGGQNESSFSFVHKSIQEFLTAVHIAAIFKTYSLPASEREETMSSLPMPEQEYSTSLSHISELDDTTCQRPVSGQDIAPLHPASEMQNIMNQHLSSEREDITFQHPDLQLEMITTPHNVSKRDNITSTQTGSEREEITCSHSGSQREYLASPNTGSMKENKTSPHLSSLKDDIPSMYTRSERDTMSSHLRSKTEDMSGREYTGWSDVCEDFIHKYCARIKTIENILEMANVFVFLSGLQPRLATYISKYIYNAANRSTLVVQHRKTLDDCAFLYDIQRCISGCCDEANSNATCFRHAIYLGDCFLDDSESVLQSRLNSKTVQHVIPDSIASLSVSFSRACALHGGSSKCDTCILLTHFLSCRRLTKLALNDKRLQTDDGHIQLVKEILETNLQSLQAVSVDYILGVKFCLKGMESFKPLIASIPNVNQLTSLRVHGINLPHDQCDILTSYLADQVRLQELSLDIVCEGKDNHEIDMSTHNTLQYLEIGDGFTVKNVYTEHDMTVKFKIKWSDDSSINRLFLILESVKLKYVSLWGNRDEFSISQFVTHKLRSLFAVSNYLCAIELDSLEITDNVLTLPFRLVSLKRIDLSVVTMTNKTWMAFIDSLHSIPNVVHVKVLGLAMFGDDLE